MAASHDPRTDPGAERHRADPDPTATPHSDADELGEPDVLATHLLHVEDSEAPRQSQDAAADWLNRVDPVERNGADATGTL
jgi:hypothetical protein